MQAADTLFQKEQKNIYGIRYWDRPWTLVKWCSHVSPGCDHCWSARLSKMLPDSDKYMNKGKFFGKIKIMENKLSMKFKPGERVSIWNDLFHKDVPVKFIADVFDAIEQHPETLFFALTKRPELISEKVNGKTLPLNLWTGATIESCDYLVRFDHLIRTPSTGYILSLEPLLGDVPLKSIFARWALASGATEKTSAIYICRVCGSIRNTFSLHQDTANRCPGSACEQIWTHVLKKIWVIIGGENDTHGRAMHPEWVLSALQDCREADVAVHFKQWGKYIPTYPYVLPGDKIVRRDGIVSGKVVRVYDKVDSLGGVTAGRYNPEGYRKESIYATHETSSFKEKSEGEVFMRAVGKRAAGRILKSRTYSEIPALNDTVYNLSGGLE